MRTAIVGLFSLLMSLPSLQSQDGPDKPPVLGCTAGAVQTNWDRNPPLEMKPIAGLPDALSYEGHEFRFPGLGQYLVEIFLTATLPEFANGGPAKLHIYAETIDSANDSQARHEQWWEMEPTQGGIEQDIRSSRSLVFDSARIRNCLTQNEDCGFADVSLATPDPNIPLVAVNFGQNLGGANAANWTEATILLDFRPTPPRVSATLDCAYNEGGGACTAFDSAEMPRTELRCDWKEENTDFLCSDNSTQHDGYVDFFLLRNKPAPLRAGEVASLDDVVKLLSSKGKDTAVTVRGIGPVSWVDEIKLSSRSRIIVLGSFGAFDIVTESEGRLGSFMRIEPHKLILDPNEVPGSDSKVGILGWTSEKAATFHSRKIFQGTNLTVLQVVAHEPPETQELMWLGIEGDDRKPTIDAIQLVGGWRYGSCGNYFTPENVLSIGKVSKPFSADVRIQPATWSSSVDESQYGWATNNNNPQDETVSTCIHTGKIDWENGHFVGSMDAGQCHAAEEPKNIQVQDDGRIVVKDNPPKSKESDSNQQP